MLSHLQITLCCVLVLAATVSARPQVFNIGFNPNPNPFPNIKGNGDGNQNPFIPQPPASSTTSTPTVQSTTPSREFYDCLGRCPTTSEYNPICGSDSQNYHNLGRFKCAVRCGANVSMVRTGTCAS